MKKSSIYLEERLDAAIGQVAALEGLSKAEFVRRVLREAVGGSDAPRPSGIGVFDGPGDLSADVDRHLADTGFGE